MSEEEEAEEGAARHFFETWANERKWGWKWSDLDPIEKQCWTLRYRADPGAFPDSDPQSDQSDQPDMVNHPPHYTSHPSGVEVIQITEHMNFCLGNAVKYILRADLKDDAIQDLEKARWYLNREIARRQRPPS